MSTDMVPFSFESHEIRTTQDEQGNPWFVAKDVCVALNISWSSATLNSIKAAWTGMMQFITPEEIKNLRSSVSRRSTSWRSAAGNRKRSDLRIGWLMSLPPSARLAFTFSRLSVTPPLFPVNSKRFRRLWRGKLKQFPRNSLVRRSQKFGAGYITSFASANTPNCLIPPADGAILLIRCLRHT